MLLTYLAGPRHDDTFARAVVRGEDSDVRDVLRWAQGNRRNVVARWIEYIGYCMDNSVYGITPDHGDMIASWPIQIVAELGIDDNLRTKLVRRTAKYIDECTDKYLRSTAERTLKVLKETT